ncbi:WxL domain-containing protein [Levilactobacillus sp. HBUAS70063]|uniref:WxL domain-containing protein n=1 Tax=Levilactobacillus sp. HBUAS70063 TaxID=3109359 RepID=UPI00313312D1
MTKKTLQLIATLALAAGFGFTTVTANAADSTDNQTTTATVGLTAGTTDPTGPHSGAVRLVAAPDLVFGDKTDGTTITGASQTINATSITTNASSSNNTATGNDKVVIEDGDVAVVNPGTTDAWKVDVKADNFVKTGDTSTTLLGAQIHFNGDVATNNDDVNVKPAVAASPTAIAGGEAVTILSATNGNGAGTWMNRLTKDTNLTIAGGNVAGSYTSNLTWTISNTPETTA